MIKKGVRRFSLRARWLKGPVAWLLIGTSILTWSAPASALRQTGLEESSEREKLRLALRPPAAGMEEEITRTKVNALLWEIEGVLANAKKDRLSKEQWQALVDLRTVPDPLEQSAALLDTIPSRDPDRDQEILQKVRNYYRRAQKLLRQVKGQAAGLEELPAVEVIRPERLVGFRPEAFLFDFDDTLWLGYPRDFEALEWARWVTGRPDPAAEIVEEIKQFLIRTAGLSWQERYNQWNDEGQPPLPADRDQFAQRFRTALREYMKDKHLTAPEYLTPGAKDLLEWLKGLGMGLAVITGGQSETPRQYAQDLGIGGFFGEGRIYGDGEKTTTIARAAKDLGVALPDVVVIEDGIPGLRAARANGALAVGFAASLEHRQKLIASGADAIIHGDFMRLAELRVALRLLPALAPEQVRVLVAEDEDSLRNMLVIMVTHALAPYGVASDQIGAFAHAGEAADWARKNRPQLILTDGNLIGGTGYEVAQASWEADPQAAVVLLSTPTDQQRQKIAELSAQTQFTFKFVQKPYQWANHLAPFVNRFLLSRLKPPAAGLEERWPDGYGLIVTLTPGRRQDGESVDDSVIIHNFGGSKNAVWMTQVESVRRGGTEFRVQVVNAEGAAANSNALVYREKPLRKMLAEVVTEEVVLKTWPLASGFPDLNRPEVMGLLKSPAFLDRLRQRKQELLKGAQEKEPGDGLRLTLREGEWVLFFDTSAEDASQWGPLAGFLALKGREKGRMRVSVIAPRSVEVTRKVPYLLRGGGRPPLHVGAGLEEAAPQSVPEALQRLNELDAFLSPSPAVTQVSPRAILVDASDHVEVARLAQALAIMLARDEGGLPEVDFRLVIAAGRVDEVVEALGAINPAAAEDFLRPRVVSYRDGDDEDLERAKWDARSRLASRFGFGSGDELQRSGALRVVSQIRSDLPQELLAFFSEGGLQFVSSEAYTRLSAILEAA